MTFKDCFVSFSCLVRNVPNGASIHLVKGLAYKIDATILKSSVEDAITNSWNDACSHEFHSKSKRNVVFTAQPWFQSVEVIPASLNPNLHCLSFEMIIGEHDAKIQLLLLRDLHVVVCQHKKMSFGSSHTHVGFLPFFKSWTLSTGDHTRFGRANQKSQVFNGCNDLFEVLDCLSKF